MIEISRYGKYIKSVVGVMVREAVYWKPNMAALKGKTGKNIMKKIRNTPPLDRELLKKKADMIEARILKNRENGE